MIQHNRSTKTVIVIHPVPGTKIVLRPNGPICSCQGCIRHGEGPCETEVSSDGDFCMTCKQSLTQEMEVTEQVNALSKCQCWCGCHNEVKNGTVCHTCRRWCFV